MGGQAGAADVGAAGSSNFAPSPEELEEENEDVTVGLTAATLGLSDSLFPFETAAGLFADVPIVISR